MNVHYLFILIFSLVLAGCNSCKTNKEIAYEAGARAGITWEGCKVLKNAKGEVGSVCISTDHQTLGICDEDGCILYTPGRVEMNNALDFTK